MFAYYYRCLGGSVWKLKGREYWRYHRSRLKDLGMKWERGRIAKAAIREAVVEAKEPLTAIRKVAAVLRGSLC